MARPKKQTEATFSLVNTYEEKVVQLKLEISQMKLKIQKNPEINDNYRLLALEVELGRIILMHEGKI